MTTKREEFIEKILNERSRQFNLPGSEHFIKNSLNDWIAVASHYLTEDVKRNGVPPSAENFEDNMIKAAAVILAALEHIDILKTKKELL